MRAYQSAVSTTAVHNTAQDSSDNLLTYLPDDHYSSDMVYWRGREQHFENGKAN